MTSEKKKLEAAACRYFLNSYNQLHGTKLRIKQHQDRPDFLVADLDRVIGIEITHLYYGDEEAKMLLGRSDKNLSDVVTTGGLVENLNGLLQDKINQAAKYQFDGEMWLVVRVASPVFEEPDFSKLEEKIVVPQTIFSQVWLLAYDAHKRTWGGLKLLK